MQNTGTGTYDYETYDVYGQAGVGAGGVAAGGAAAAATYPPSHSNNGDYQYPQQDYGYSSQQGHEYAQQGQQPGALPSVNGATAASMSLRDGMMARVQVGFNRTLEDELGE